MFPIRIQNRKFQNFMQNQLFLCNIVQEMDHRHWAVLAMLVGNSGSCLTIKDKRTFMTLDYVRNACRPLFLMLFGTNLMKHCLLSLLLSQKSWCECSRFQLKFPTSFMHC